MGSEEGGGREKTLSKMRKREQRGRRTFLLVWIYRPPRPIFSPLDWLLFSVCVGSLFWPFFVGAKSRLMNRFLLRRLLSWFLGIALFKVKGKWKGKKFRRNQKSGFFKMFTMSASDTTKKYAVVHEVHGRCQTTPWGLWFGPIYENRSTWGFLWVYIRPFISWLNVISFMLRNCFHDLCTQCIPVYFLVSSASNDRTYKKLDH